MLLLPLMVNGSYGGQPHQKPIDYRSKGNSQNVFNGVHYPSGTMGNEKLQRFCGDTILGTIGGMHAYFDNLTQFCRSAHLCPAQLPRLGLGLPAAP